MNAQHNRYSIIPPGETCCVWMSAGVLSFQLCSHECDCDDCPVDQAMRLRCCHPAAVGAGFRAPRQRSPERPELDADCRYSRNHWWSRRIDEGLFRLGLEPGMSEALVAIRSLVFSPPKQSFGKKQICLWIVMEGGTLTLESPYEGTVRRVNDRLLEEPHLLALDPFDCGWLYEVETEEGCASALMESEAARRKYKKDEARFTNLLEHASRRKNPRIGSTLADGGARLRNAAEIVGPARYFSILKQVFS